MFSKKPDPATMPRMGTKSAGGGSTFSVIGTDVTINGNIDASSELHVEGRVIGDIVCASLVQGEASVIDGVVTAETARMAGRLNGSITARHLVILKDARIEGDVRYEALTIEQGAVVEGRFSPSGVKKTETGEERGEPGERGEPKLALAT